MDEAPGRVMAKIGQMAEQTAADAIEDHEQRMHIPPAEHGPLQAIPYPSMRMTDLQSARAREMFERDATLEEVLLALDVPLSVLERCMAEYKPRWRKFLQEREAGA